MALATRPTELDIINRIKTVLSRVYETEVPAGLSPGDPYIVIYFGEPIRTGADRHITSVVNDTLRGYFTVQVVSKNADAAAAVKDRVRAALIGYRPVDSGEITPRGGMSYSQSDSDGSNVLYYRELGFDYLTNLTFVQSG